MADTVDFRNALVPTGQREQLPVVLPDNTTTKAAIAIARKELNIDDSQSLVFFGAKVQNGLASVATQMMEGVKNKDIAPASEALSNVVLNIRGFSLDDLEEKSGFFGKLQSIVMRQATPVVRALQRYETVNSQINTIVADLDRHVGVLMKDVVSLDRLYAEALRSFLRLKIYIAAGEAELADINENRLPALVTQAKAGDDMAVQTAAKLQAVAQRLERRVHDFKLTCQVTLQALPAIMGMQDNDADLVGKIQSAIANTIPLWKQRIAMLITAKHTEQAARAIGSVEDITNEMLVKTAKAMKDANSVVRAEIERGAFDLKAIQEANESAVAMLEETRSVYETAAARRKEESVALEGFERAIKEAIVR